MPDNWQDWNDDVLEEQDFLFEPALAFDRKSMEGHQSGIAVPEKVLLEDQPSFEFDNQRDCYSVRALSQSTGVSKSEVSVTLKRCYVSGLAKQERGSGIPRVNTKALLEFVAYGLRYVFPARRGEITRGIKTGLAAPVLQGELMTAGDLVPVWPDARGNTMGAAIEPLFKSVPMAVRKDSALYAYLALVDAIRMGLPRERNFATEKLNNLIRI